jgi:phosphotransferase system IIA component
MMEPGPAGKLSKEDVDLLAVIAMAGVAAEGMGFEKVVGQNADLYLLQKILNKSLDKLPAAQQQSVTRWAVRAPFNGAHLPGCEFVFGLGVSTG